MEAVNTFTVVVRDAMATEMATFEIKALASARLESVEQAARFHAAEMGKVFEALFPVVVL